jgi:hypothetical protein
MFLACFAKAYAQNGYGPEMSIGNTSVQYIAPSKFTTLSTGTMSGFRLGAIADLQLNGQLYFQSGLYFTVRSFSKSILADSAGILYEHVDESMEIHYLEMPLSLMFKTGRQGWGRICIAAGATISYVVGGVATLHDYGMNIKQQPFDNSSNITLVGGHDLNAIDVGLNLSLGYEMYKGLYFKLYYYHGFNNLSTFGDESFRLRSLGIGMGYFMGKGRHIHAADELIAE